MDFPHCDKGCTLQQLLRTFLARYVAYAAMRSRRLADGPDEVHRDQIGKLEAAQYRTRADYAAPSA